MRAAFVLFAVLATLLVGTSAVSQLRASSRSAALAEPDPVKSELKKRVAKYVSTETIEQ